ncbi:hypothetical protein J6590_059007 [Homalodisca vitripennis]|nr:hypothetical protein J6590_059007 [Homalodisca vitripennis]
MKGQLAILSDYLYLVPLERWLTRPWERSNATVRSAHDLLLPLSITLLSVTVTGRNTLGFP